METIRKGLVKRIHVNKHQIGANRKYGTAHPVLTIQTSQGPIRAARVEVRGPGTMIYRPDKPLSCGAVCWYETTAEVAYE